MFCTSCGAQVDDNAAFCTSCGTPLQKPADDAAANAAPETEPDNTNPNLTTAVTDAEVFESIRTHAEAPVFSDGVGGAPGTPGHTSAIGPNAAPVSSAFPSEPAGFAAQQAPQASQPFPTQAGTGTAVFAAAPASNPKKSSKKIALIVAIVCIVVLLAVGIGIFAFMQMKKNEAEHATTEVQFAFSYSGDAANEPVGVPLLVEGTDLDGNHAEQQILATSSGGTLELLAGSYTISVDGMPASSSGVVYEVQGENLRTLEIPVPSEDENEPQPIIPDLNYSFTPVAADKITDQQVEDIKSWMTTYGVNPSEINSIAATIIERRNAEIARITLEREKQTALASNPSGVYGTNINSNAPVAQLTGTVCVEYFKAQGGLESGNVCYLQLPGTVKLLGTQYDGMTSNRVILPEGLSSYKGQVVTISSHFSGRPTASIKEANCSPIWAYDATVVRTF